MTISLREVKNQKELNAFITLPDILYKNEPNYIPALHKEEREALTPRLNSASEYCESQLWLAYKDDEIVGRVCAIINHRANQHWNEKVVRFGWFDFIEDIEVCRLLLDKVIEFGKEHQMQTIHGPMGFTDMDKECWVIEGFEHHQNLSTIFNPPYYVEFIKQLGYAIDCEWQQFKITIDPEIPDKITRVSNLVKEKYGLRILKVKRRKDILPYGKKFFLTLNQCYTKLYGFVPLSEKDIDIQVKKYFSFVNLGFVSFVIDANDDVVGFGLGLPDLSKALKKANGSLLPFGWIRALYAMNHFDTIDLLLTGVHPDWQKRGVLALFHEDMHRTAIKMGVKYAYTNPQIANLDAVKIWKGQYSQVDPTFRRAIFSKSIE